MENFRAATHTEVRNELMAMQQAGGAMINPFAFPQIIALSLRQDELPKKGSKELLRSYAYTFCAIANEYFLIYCRDKHPKTRFYISEDRWEKYFISADVRERDIEYLQKSNLIVCTTNEMPPDNRPVRAFEINFERLNIFRRAAEEVYDAKRKNKNPF